MIFFILMLSQAFTQICLFTFEISCSIFYFCFTFVLNLTVTLSLTSMGNLTFSNSKVPPTFSPPHAQLLTPPFKFKKIVDISTPSFSNSLTSTQTTYLTQLFTPPLSTIKPPLQLFEGE